ncbi:MAG: HD domain-containing protein [Salinivirgaceae bacterium]|nr:HD domain-containing protein [Salinivirgaceae bacterium]
MIDSEIIEKTKAFVKNELKNAEGGHDWWHIERVYNTSKTIAKWENGKLLVIELASLLHDIADSKFNNGDEEIGPQRAQKFLETQAIDELIIQHVVKIIQNVSFKGGSVERTFTSLELDIVQDADRLDAIGAIGIARTFNYGGVKNREIYNPTMQPDLNMNKEQYKNSTAPTINHFYEKLLLLKDKMNTETGRKMAIQRHEFMQQFLTQFYAEWKGDL